MHTAISLLYPSRRKKEFILEWSNSPIFIFDCRTAVTRLPTLETCFVIKGTTKVTKTALCVLLVCNRVTATLNCCSLSVGHSESRRMTDELGSRQRDLSTSSVTKRANGHWHAIIASSCRWSQREYKRQPVHRINHPFASEPSGGIHYCSSCPRVRNWVSECGRYSTAVVVAVSREKEKTVPVKTVTLGVCGGQPPACFSTKRADFSKRVHGWSRLFKDVLSPVRFWVRSISGASGRSRSLPHVSGHSARWGSFRGWFMFFMWGHDHLGVAQ